MATATGTMKPTLSLTGITVNAMALIAPGAFLWTTFALQASQTNGGTTTAPDMWTGLVLALVLAFLTAYSYSELANLYPQAGTGSSYYFAEAALLNKEREKHYRYARIAKVTVGWISHLYYWIYPGIMAAFAGYLFTYLFSIAGINLNFWAIAAVVVLFTLSNTYVAYRGVSGSTLAAIVINVIQIVSLIAFSIFALIFRATHPSLQYENGVGTVITGSHNVLNILYHGTIAILLLVGFESVTSLGAEAKNPKRDIRRGILLSLAIQGLIMYLFEYFATNMVVGSVNASGKLSGYASAAASSAPVGDMLKGMGNIVFGGNVGQVLAVFVAVTVVIALFGTMLACLNTGVRVTYAMGRDKEMPTLLGALHGRYATPHFGVWILGGLSALIGIYAATDLDHLNIVTVASNVGTFLVYGMTNLIALIAFWSHHERGFVKHRLVPAVGALANVGMLLGVIVLAIKAGNTGTPGGNTATDATLSIIIVAIWAVAGAIWFGVNTARQGKPVMVRGNASA
ncbi:MAG: amino acid permease [Candidatus Dormibacteria bacterium]